MYFFQLRTCEVCSMVKMKVGGIGHWREVHGNLKGKKKGKILDENIQNIKRTFKNVRVSQQEPIPHRAGQSSCVQQRLLDTSQKLGSM